jgi:2-methylcitrate dehydratase PrpD
MARSTAATLTPAQSTDEPATQRLAAYAATLRYEDLPPAAVERAKHCLIDAIGCVIFGRQFPWSKIVLAEAAASGSGGPCRVPGNARETFHVPPAALALGALAHAFEFDNLRKPGTGVHPGATAALPAFAMAQAVNASGASLITATVAGIEVMFRIGAATLHSPEHIGFHAPGLTGPFGAASACASLMRMSAEQTANAFGIAGSLAGGLMAFAKAGSGGMVKRLHLGRAAEGGVVAARLAQRGFEGPRNVLEGRYGVLVAFCDDKNPALLTKGLGQIYETDRVCFKRYPCHVTAHVPVQLLRGFVEQHGFGGDDVRDLAIEASAKVASHHSEREPADIMLAQYSVPFCVAIAAHHDPLDPAVFSDQVVGETRVRDLAKRIRMTTDDSIKGWGARMRVTLHDGRSFEGASDTWLGCPETPLSTAQLRVKFDRLTQGSSSELKATLFDDLMRLEQLPSLERLALA